MSTLGTGKRRSSDGERGIPSLQLDLHPLVTKQVDTGTPMTPSIPVTPEDWSRTDHHWMQQHADLTWLRGGPAIPLALFTQGAGATTADTGRVQHAQAAISFSAPFMGRQS